MPYKEIGMKMQGGLSKDIYSGVHVPYMSETQRLRYLVSFKKGKLYWRDARLNTNPGGSWAFVMDKNGRVFCGNKNGDINHHSAFFSGNPVACAGHISVENGKLTYINNFSGHYQPTRDYMEQFLTELRKNGVDLKDVEMKLGITSKVYTVRAKHVQDSKYKGKWYQRFRGTSVKETVDGCKSMETGRSHIQGQTMRLYPDGPKWGWF